MKSLFKFLGISQPNEATPGADTETVRKIIERLDKMPVDEARYVAAFAYILGRVAHADLEITRAETEAMEKIIHQEAGLGEDQAMIVIQMAKSQNKLFGGTENYLVTQEFNKIATREQKMALLRCLFAVCAVDGNITVVEDNEIRQISRELRLDHRDFIDIRVSFRDHLAVLKKPGEEELSD